MVFVDILPLREIYPRSSVTHPKKHEWKTIPRASVLNVVLCVHVNSLTEACLVDIQEMRFSSNVAAILAKHQLAVICSK